MTPLQNWLLQKTFSFSLIEIEFCFYCMLYSCIVPKGTVTFTRQGLDHLPNWDNDDTKLTGLHVSSEGTIEDDGLGLLQVMYR